MSQTETDFVFTTKAAAVVFRDYLKKSPNDRRHGHPKFISMRMVNDGWYVTYTIDADKHDFTEGVAFGCDMMYRRLLTVGVEV